MRKNYKQLMNFLLAAIILPAFCTSIMAQSFKTEEAPMMRGVTKNVKNGWTTDPLITVGETNNAGEDVNLLKLNYRIPGIPDGIGAWKKGVNVKLVVNSELADSRGYPYMLANGTILTGARMNYFEISRITRETKEASLAYHTVYDRTGAVVTNANQVNEGLNNNYGFNRFCSGNGINGGKSGFPKDIYFAGEETSGGQLCVLDVNSKELHVVPMAGRAAFENVTPIENYNTNKVAFLIGDDRGPAPLILYIGEKGSTAEGYNPLNPFLKANGLSNGRLYVWVADGQDRDLTGFHGTGAQRSGKFVKIEHYKASLKGTTGYDAMGFADQAKQEELADAKGYFRFSRPEDLAANPDDPTQIVMASTGLSSLLGGVDSWGDVYIIDINNTDLRHNLRKPLQQIDNIRATIKIVYDGDDAGGGMFAGPDFGIRSPDNVTWAGNGYIYVNEDRSVTGFGLTSKIEASVWQLNPETGSIERILEMDRNAVPFMQTDGAPTDTANWESSGVLDVSEFFATKPHETVLILDVQAHSLNSTIIGGNDNLAEGGQLLLASKILKTRKPHRKGKYESYNEEITSYSKFANAAINDDSKKLRAFPNPAHDLIKFNMNADVRLYDMSGKLLISEKNTRQINTASLGAGTYIIRSAKNEQLKIVIQ